MNRIVFPWVIICLAMGFYVSVQAAQTAAPLTLAWNPANDATIKGYAIYYGPINQPPTNRLDARLTNSATIFNMQANVTYKLYAVSYNALGVESVPSNSIEVKQGTVSGLKIEKQTNGNMKLTFRAAPGAVGQVQYASSPTGATWRNLGTVPADANGNGSLIDTNRTSSRFYRVAVP